MKRGVILQNRKLKIPSEVVYILAVALLSLDEMKSGAVTVPSSGESCANFAAALNAGATLFNDTPAATLPGKPDVVLRKWTASESYPVLEK